MINEYANDITGTLEWLGYNFESENVMEYPNGTLAVTVTIRATCVTIEEVLEGLKANLPTYPNIKDVKIGGHQVDGLITLIAFYEFWY